MQKQIIHYIIFLVFFLLDFARQITTVVGRMWHTGRSLCTTGLTDESKITKIQSNIWLNYKPSIVTGRNCISSITILYLASISSCTAWHTTGTNLKHSRTQQHQQNVCHVWGLLWNVVKS